MRSHIDNIERGKQSLLGRLKTLNFVKGFLGTNDANFLLVQIVDANQNLSNELAFNIYKHLAEVDGVVVRFRGNELGCNGCLRITIGTDEENTILFNKLEGFVH
jgi:histidinol-phosphate aminotransferase